MVEIDREHTKNGKSQYHGFSYGEKYSLSMCWLTAPMHTKLEISVSRARFPRLNVLSMVADYETNELLYPSSGGRDVKIKVGEEALKQLISVSERGQTALKILGMLHDEISSREARDGPTVEYVPVVAGTIGGMAPVVLSYKSDIKKLKAVIADLNGTSALRR